MSMDTPLAYASFSIYQDAEPPDFWTAYFNVLPDRSGVKGELKVLPSGRVSESRWRFGYWSVSSEAAVRSNRLEPHLRYLVERLGLPRDDLRATIARTDARMRFFCYWHNETGDRVPDVPDDIRVMMESLGGTIEIDEYR
ncbi:hypothetical protein AYM40_23805 [Paraburkholderia phytofirmans OLGA172]|uniref:DUF4279 domain-containing protein n=2 Tax=Paraburkholderia phytofirmans TaxID=261302 RepID=A0A160FRI6_9BURK|nr:hypothetical protein AYM40_23805 [Paraburkholderia phytofirmans OLGA172]